MSIRKKFTFGYFLPTKVGDSLKKRPEKPGCKRLPKRKLLCATLEDRQLLSFSTSSSRQSFWSGVGSTINLAGSTATGVEAVEGPGQFAVAFNCCDAKAVREVVNTNLQLYFSDAGRVLLSGLEGSKAEEGMVRPPDEKLRAIHILTSDF